MKLVALTGGMGSGKSTVAVIFDLLGVPVYNSDLAARKLMENDRSLKNKLIKKFGKQSFQLDGKLNTSFISQIVFNDTRELQWLNKTVHPFVAQDVSLWIKGQNSVYGLMETALLLESMAFIKFSKIIFVKSPIELRLQRINSRDHLPRVEIQKKLDSQANEPAVEKLSDYAIENNDITGLISQVLAIHHKLNEAFR
ncbi:MAG: dephospho-CoA kinase [Saprospiraceae bacterium]|nr:dephospho-CoA kinase [Saprospiraceae bacterium]